MDERTRKLVVAAEEIELRTWCAHESDDIAKRARLCRASTEPVPSAEHAALLDSYAGLLRRIGGLSLMAQTLLGDEEPTR